jgi:hypothetical protein
MMEICEEYQYKNSLNIFSLTLGPFDHPPPDSAKDLSKSQALKKVEVGEDADPEAELPTQGNTTMASGKGNP